MCSIIIDNQQCGNSVYTNNMCKYHYDGGKMITKCCFYSTNKQKWLQSPDLPRKGDIKYDFNSFFKFDGKQWRKQCILCNRMARPLYCASHSNSGTYKMDFSKISCKFIDDLEKELNVKIIHKHISDENFVCGTEYFIPSTKYNVDGIIENTNTVIEILGNYWHGNPKIYDSDKINKTTGNTFGYLLQKTFTRFQNIHNLGYKILYVWEKEIEDNVNIKRFNLLKEFNPNQSSLFYS